MVGLAAMMADAEGDGDGDFYPLLSQRIAEESWPLEEGDIREDIIGLRLDFPEKVRRLSVPNGRRGLLRKTPGWGGGFL